MGKGQDAKKAVKKEPLKTAKEKKEEKREKKAKRAQLKSEISHQTHALFVCVFFIYNSTF